MTNPVDALAAEIEAAAKRLLGPFQYTAYRGRAPEGVPVRSNDIQLVASSVARLIERVREAEEMAKPLAEKAKAYDIPDVDWEGVSPPDDDRTMVTVALGYLRSADRFLTGGEDGR